MRRLSVSLALLALLALHGCTCGAGDASGPVAHAASALPTAATARPSGFLKGQLHAHSNGSGDSDVPALDVARFYAAHGFDFVVITDHNRVTPLPKTSAPLLLQGVELTANLSRCDPPPEQLGCLLHENVLALTSPEQLELPPRDEQPKRVDVYASELRVAQAMGGVAQLNHPNFRFAADADTMVELAAAGLALVEIENRAIDSQNEGDSKHPSVEAAWDAALTRGARLFATATDDAHEYGLVSPTGETPLEDGDRGFVMVRADLTADAIRSALARGDFYASTGVVLESLETSPSRLALVSRETLDFEVIADARVVRRERATSLELDPSQIAGRYVRVRATDGRGRHAFTQPVWKTGAASPIK